MVKVIFMQNIDSYSIGDVKEVPDGYARNFLFPRGAAKIATEGEIKNLEVKMNSLKKEEEKKVKESEAVASSLAKKKISLDAEVNEEGHLYGAITNKDISETFEKLGFEIETANIIIPEHIKEIGKHTILVRFGHGVEKELSIEVKRK